MNRSQSGSYRYFYVMALELYHDAHVCTIADACVNFMFLQQQLPAGDLSAFPSLQTLVTAKDTAQGKGKILFFICC